MAIPTTSLLIVCTAAAQTLVNGTLNRLDPDSTGDVLVVPLQQRSSPGRIAAFWASWQMEGSTRSALNTAVRDATWSPRPTVGERRIYVPGDAVPSFGSQRMWLFDGPTYPFQAALDVLGLALMPDEE